MYRIDTWGWVFMYYISNIVFPLVFTMAGRIIIGFQFFRASNSRTMWAKNWNQHKCLPTKVGKWHTVYIQIVCLCHVFAEMVLLICSVSSAAKPFIWCSRKMTKSGILSVGHAEMIHPTFKKNIPFIHPVISPCDVHYSRLLSMWPNPHHSRCWLSTTFYSISFSNMYQQLDTYMWSGYWGNQWWTVYATLNII